MKIVVPAAGSGRRFAEAGSTFPKPLIDVGGKPMIQRVVENLGFDGQHVFIVQREHCERFKLDGMLRMLRPGSEVIVIDGVTEGAACTVLKARHLIDDDEELLIANSDQLVEFSQQNFRTMREWTPAEGIVFTFNAVHPKWSYVACDRSGAIVRVAEKDPISDIATCGIYYFRHGASFVEAADRMIRAGDRTNGEFYVAPVFNYVIKGIEPGPHHLVLPFFVERMHGLGTPEDLGQYLAGHHEGLG